MSTTFSAEGLLPGVDPTDGGWAPNELEVNMASGNAALVCAALGLTPTEEGWVGELAPQDFLGRVLLALAVSPADEGMPSRDLQPGDDAGPLLGVVREGGPRIIQGARHPGYLQERLTQLRALADWAVAHDAPVFYD